MRTHCLALAAVLASALTANGKTAAPPSAAVNMDLAVADAMRSALAGEFDEGHIAMLQALGHQQAVAATCTGFKIDPAAFSGEFDLVYDNDKGNPRTLTVGQRIELERKATMALGMAFGAQIAISANDREAFCLAAAQERSNGKAEHLVWAK